VSHTQRKAKIKVLLKAKEDFLILISFIRYTQFMVESGTIWNVEDIVHQNQISAKWVVKIQSFKSPCRLGTCFWKSLMFESVVVSREVLFI
jgi:hypothetical protein